MPDLPPPLPRRLARLGLSLVALAGGPFAATAAAAVTAAARPAVLGFVNQGSPPSLIDRSLPALTTVGVAGISLDGTGQVAPIDPAAQAQLARARHDHRRGVLLVTNWDSSTGNFSEPLAFQTFGDPAATDRAAATTAQEVRAGGWDGVSLDMEKLLRRDRDGLTRFAADLRAALPRRDEISLCLEPYESLSQYGAGGVDLQRLQDSVSRFVAMTYDDHGPWGAPGAIAPLSWQRRVVQTLTRVVAPGRILLGVADYAYAWPAPATSSLSVAGARGLARRDRARPRWVAAAGEWTASLPGGRTLWWSDGRSVRLRASLARSLHVAGIAVWSLGTGDAITLPGG